MQCVRAAVLVREAEQSKAANWLYARRGRLEWRARGDDVLGVAAYKDCDRPQQRASSEAERGRERAKSIKTKRTQGNDSLVDLIF